MMFFANYGILLECAILTHDILWYKTKQIRTGNFKRTFLVLRSLLVLLGIVLILPFKGFGIVVCNVWNSFEDFKPPVAETIFLIVLVLNHVIAIVTVNGDSLKISDADRPYKKAVKKEGDKASKVFDMGDFLKEQRKSYAKTETCLLCM